MGEVIENGRTMRIPLDYDGLPANPALLDVLVSLADNGLLGDPKVQGFEVWGTSPGNTRVIVIADVDMDTALQIIQASNCDPDYKDWVKRKRQLTERITRKNMTGQWPKRLF